MTRYVWALLAVLLLVSRAAAGLPVGVTLAPPAPAPPPDNRDALVFGALRFYRSAEHNREGYEQLISGLRLKGVPVYPRVVLGSYLDLVDWITRGRIDLAWLPPLSYISAKKNQPNLTPLATVLRRDAAGNLKDSTSSVLVMRKGEMPKSLEALERKRVVFGAELSTSGFLLPLHFLTTHGVDVPQPYQYAGSQQQAVDLLLGTTAAGPGADVIGISELTIGALPPATVAKLDTLPVTGADGAPLKIPNDAIVARAGLSPETLSRVRDALLALGEGKPGIPPDFFHSELGVVGFRPFDAQPYGPVEQIVATGLLKGDRYNAKAVLDSMKWDIELEADLAKLEKRPYKPRLALVLAGGGAAGCYQAGAAMEVCRAMAEHKMAPDIVVGTSVGAINGLAVALGRPDVLERFWSSIALDTVMEVRPDDLPLGVWKVWLIRLAQRAPALLTMMIFLVLAYLEVVLLVWALRPLRLSGPGGLLLIGLVFALCNLLESRLTAPTLVTLASLTVAHGLIVWMRRRPPPPFFKVWLRRVHALALALALLILPAQLYRAFGDREALFATDGLHRTLCRFFLDMRGQPIPDNDSDLLKAATEASKQAVAEGLAHTLVISTTDFQRQTGRVFYASKDKDVERRAQECGYTSIADEMPGQLLDGVVASAAVFPVLEPRPVTLKNGETLRLIDGGFVHNNPVQVAVDLGATHVIIIKPSMDQDFVEGEPSLLASLFSFFGWLIARSQTEDLRAKDEVMSFLISPGHEHHGPVISPLEFDGHYSGNWGLDAAPALSLKAYYEAGAKAARSSDLGFQLWSRGTFKLPPAQR